MSHQRANATVVDVCDPEQRGRVKVRPDRLPDASVSTLPWRYMPAGNKQLQVGDRVIY